MKTIFALLALATIGLMHSCKSEPTKESPNRLKKDQEEEVKEKEIIVRDFSLSAEASTIKWSRTLDQKSVKRTMKIFGSDVEVNMDAVKMKMNGQVTPVTGGFVIEDDLYKKADLSFDMATFKFSEQKGKGLFDLKKYPTSSLKFLSFEEGDFGSYSAKCELTIQGHTEEIEFPVSITLKRDDCHLKGSFYFNTLLFPLRSPNQEAEINKDVITVVLDLVYLIKEK